MSNRGEMSMFLQPRQQMRMEMQPSSQASRVADYDELINHPLINDVELVGNKTSENLKIVISKSAEDWAEYSEVVSYIGTAYVYVGTETMVKYGDGVSTIGELPFVSAEDPRITDNDITNWNEKSNVEANPDGATIPLTSLGINGTNYSVAGAIIKTTAEWEQVPQMRSIEGVWYVYSDYRQETDPVTHTTKNIPRVKIGDRFGTYVVDLPFTTMSITDADIAKWNSHVGVMVEGTNLSFFH